MGNISTTIIKAIINKGGTVVQWLGLLPHSKKVLGVIPSQVMSLHVLWVLWLPLTLQICSSKAKLIGDP